MRAGSDFALRQPLGRRLDELQLCDGAITDAVNFLQSFGRSRNNLSERAKPCDEPFRNRLRVDEREGAKKNQFEQSGTASEPPF